MVVFRLIICLTSILVLASCARLQDDNETTAPPRLPAAKMMSDSVSLEIAVVRVNPEDTELLDVLWGELDQQIISLQTRRILDQNGFRCGVAPSYLPAIFHDLVQHSPTEGKPFPSPLDPDTKMIVHQRIQNRTGETYHMQIADIVPQFNWQVTDGNGRTRSGVCRQAKLELAVNTFPQGDGTVIVKIRPVIRHGEERPRFTVAGDDILFRPEQLLDSIDELVVGTRLRLGETLILGPCNPVDGLGKKFLVDQSGDGKRRIILIRLMQAQLDDLFAPERIQSPVGTY